MKRVTQAISIAILAGAFAFHAYGFEDLQNASILSTTTGNSLIMQHIQTKLDKAQMVIDDLQDNNQLQNLNDEDKNYIQNIYIISPKTGEILHFPTLKQEFAKPDGKVLSQETIKSWQENESQVVFASGKYFTRLAISKSGDLYILAIENIYIVTDKDLAP